MDDFQQTDQPTDQPTNLPPNLKKPKKKWPWVLAAVIGLGVISYLLASSSLFKGALYVDDEMEAKKTLSETASIKTDIQETKTTSEDKVLNCDVVVVGGGTGGTAAAIASAREGAKTCLIEETNWLGGMMTSAGVGGIDGRRDSPSGIFYEIIQRIIAYYESKGQISRIHNCTVSYICFEPTRGAKILEEMANEEKNLKVYFNSEVDKVYREKDQILGVHFIKDEKGYIAKGDVTIDATEYGDIMYMANIPYDLGYDQGSKEPLARKAEKCVQPLTYVGILREYDSPKPVSKPKNYDTDNFECVVKNPSCPNSNSLVDVDRLLSYGRMPYSKLMINIPSHSYGNDFHATAPNLDNLSREEILEEAKAYTMGFLYYLQTEIPEFKNFRLYNEFGTEDGLAKIPYVRESRRLQGIERLTENDITEAGGTKRSDVVEDAIAIGDYPIDLHFCKYGIGDIFKVIEPYQIPYGVTVPEEVDGFLAADKNISVSHIVNGTTRLQPVTMSVGQAVGTAAAMASKANIEPRDIDVAELQEKLINAGSNLFFFTDLPTQHWAYKSVAELAVKNLISGYSDLSFRPKKSVKESEFSKIFEANLLSKNQSTSIMNFLDIKEDSSLLIDRKDVVEHLYSLMDVTNTEIKSTGSANLKFKDIPKSSSLYEKLQALVSSGIVNGDNSNFRPNDDITRAEAVVLLEKAMDVIFN